MSVKKNIVANYAGQGWTAIMGLVFIPLYIKYLGVEAYGLIGIFAMLQTWFALLDIGMSPALSREMARYMGGGHDPKSIRDLLRSVEIFGFIIACLILLVVWTASSWLATEWLRPQQLSHDTIVHALVIMGGVCGLRFVENIYKGSITGLQRQVELSVLLSIIATVRGGGAVLVLVYVSDSIQAFFFWQGLVSIISIIMLVIFLYKIMPKLETPPEFSWGVLRQIWGFAGGMFIILILATLLTQTDKVILSRLLSLEAFGYYTLASTIASILYMLPSPISQAVYPKFTEFVTRGDTASLIQIFHKGAQLVSVFMGSVSMLLIFFSDVLLSVWTGNGVLIAHVAPILSVLTLGTLLNGLMWLPGQMQLAHGVTRIGVYINCVAVVLLIPMLLWVVPRYGAIGAAWSWVVLNTGYLLLGAQFLYKRMLPQEKWRWYLQDIACPVAAAALIAFTIKNVIPTPAEKINQAVLLIIAGVLILVAAGLAATHVKKQFCLSIQKAINGPCSHSR